MTNPAPGPTTPAWDLSVLDHPTVLTVPDHLGPEPDPNIAVAAVALERQTAGDPTAANLVRQLAHAGIVAIQTTRGLYIPRETLTSWLLLPYPTRPVHPADLAAAAAIRAYTLAALRHHPDGEDHE
jgi:hypothetical protein